MADLYREYRFCQAVPTVGAPFDDQPARRTDWFIAFKEMDETIEAAQEAKRFGQMFGGR